MTTDKNNFCYGGQHASRFKIAARRRGEAKVAREEVLVSQA